MNAKDLAQVLFSASCYIGFPDQSATEKIWSSLSEDLQQKKLAEIAAHYISWNKLPFHDIMAWMVIYEEYCNLVQNKTWVFTKCVGCGKPLDTVALDYMRRYPHDYRNGILGMCCVHMKGEDHGYGEAPEHGADY